MNHRQEFHYRPDFENTDVTAINRLPAGAPWRAHESEASAAVYDAPSRYLVSLDGDFEFALVDSPDKAGGFYREDAPALPGTIPVPGNWELFGHGEPIYTNYICPWPLEGDVAIAPSADGRPVPNLPYVPQHNPTGLYRKRFTLPEAFAGREVYIRLDGVESAYYLWLNGRPVGYAQDSKLPSLFDLTPFVRPGENLLALEVIKWSDGTYFEDQDYWHLGGVNRSVWLIAKPALHIADYALRALPDLSRGGGSFCADVSVARRPFFADCRVRVTLHDADGRTVGRGAGAVLREATYNYNAAVPAANMARVSFHLDRAEVWSPDRPYLYTAVMALLSPAGEVLDVESCRVGFKSVEVKNGIVLLNGRRLLVRGVNRHEHCPQGGRVVSREHMAEEIRQMKLMNINSVRTCHYPDTPLWYDLCDELGILLVCECNLETHAVMGRFTHDPALVNVFVERAARMVLTHRSHASIYSWSLGNESGTGANHAAMAGFVRSCDETRLCQYEAGSPGKDVSDIRGRMYASIEQIRAMLCDPVDDRPIILVEYAYQIRNSGGGLHAFMELTRECPRFQGGYVWDWQDKCLIGKTADGAPFYGYGGDFGESFAERGSVPRFMTNNGVVLPDLTWKPVAHELKQAYAPIVILRRDVTFRNGAASHHEYQMCNRSHDLPATAFSCMATLRENGCAVQTVQVPLPEAGPGEAAAFTFSVPFEAQPGCRYDVDFQVSLIQATACTPPNYPVGHFQFLLPPGPAAVLAGMPAGDVRCGREGGVAYMQAEDVRVEVEEATGLLRGLYRGGSLLASGGQACLDRPYTGLDAQPGWGWYDAFAWVRSLAPRAARVEVSAGEGGARVEASWRMRDGQDDAAGVRIAYALDAAGRLSVDASVQVYDPLRFLPRVGLEFHLPAGFVALTYWGMGPMETYPDRRMCGVLAVHESSVSAEHFSFIPPSECGGHEETRCLTIGAPSGATLRVEGERPFHFDAHHSSVRAYQEAAHDHQLSREPRTTLHIDLAHGPIGGDMAWSTVMPQDCLRGGAYHLRFSLLATGGR